MKFRKNKKGFTIVELIIVIAVIGVLTAVMVPTIVHLVGKANEASDKSLVSNLNKAIQMRYAETSKKPETMYETVKGLEEYGYKLDALVAKSDQALLYDLDANQFLREGDKDPNRMQFYWKVQDRVEASQKYYETAPSGVDFSNKYNIYANKDFVFEEGVKLNVSFDAGENSRVTSIFYQSSESKQNVVLRSNSTLTELTVDAENEKVNHYGNAKTVNVTAVAPHSYHENGSVSVLNVNAGKIEIEEDAFVGKLALSSVATEESVEIINNGNVFASEVVTYVVDEETGAVETSAYEGESTAATTIAGNVEKTSAEDELGIGSAEALINLAYSHSQGVVSGTMDIKLTADIDLSGKVWVPFGLSISNPFEGTFNGNGKTIKGLSYDASVASMLQTFNSASDEGTPFGLIAYAQKNVTVKGLTIEANIEVPNGEAVAEFIGVYNNLTVSGDTNEYKLEISNCTAKGSVVSGHKVAGFVGTGFITQSTKSDSFAYKYIGANNVRAKTAYVFENCTSSVEVLANGSKTNRKAGGFASGLTLYVTAGSGAIGGSSLSITNCLYNGSSVACSSASNSYGAFCGYLSGSGSVTVDHSSFTNSSSIQDVYVASSGIVW